MANAAHHSHFAQCNLSLTGYIRVSADSPRGARGVQLLKRL
jgi:hypothetical protein